MQMFLGDRKMKDIAKMKEGARINIHITCTRGSNKTRSGKCKTPPLTVDSIVMSRNSRIIYMNYLRGVRR